MDKNMSTLLKWSIENSTTSLSTDAPDAPSTQAPMSSLNKEFLSALLGGPSDADLMRSSMAAIQSPDIDLENKLVAFDNFEQLIEQIDNANNLEPLGLWTPLKDLLSAPEDDLKRMAAWCIGTAVQNNIKAQERALVVGVIDPLIGLATQQGGEDKLRRKSAYALSSAMRNFQPGVDEVLRILGDRWTGGKVDAGEMGEVDAVMEFLKK
jgi:hsp70-interacting protein